MAGSSLIRVWGVSLTSIAQWSGHIFGLASRGLVKLVIGGPPCRTVSRLRNKGPLGPRRVRGRGLERFGLANLSPEEMEWVDGDTGLVPQTGGSMEKGRRGSRAENWWCRCLADSYRLSS